MSENIAAALSKAQAEFPEIHRTRSVTVRTKTGGSYSYSYAPHPEITRAIKEAMAANGLAVAQPLSHIDGRPAIRTILTHESGEFLEDICPLPLLGGESAQEIGSAITYMRRYALTAILGIATEDDDDGAAASTRKLEPEYAAHKSAGEPTATRPASEPEPNDGSAESGVFASPAERLVQTAMAAQTAREHPSGPPQDDGKPENVVLTFGKHKGQPLRLIPRPYLEWLTGKFEAKTSEQRRILMAAQELLGAGKTEDPYPDIPF